MRQVKRTQQPKGRQQRQTYAQLAAYPAGPASPTVTYQAASGVCNGTNRAAPTTQPQTEAANAQGQHRNVLPNERIVRIIECRPAVPLIYRIHQTGREQPSC